MNGDGSRSARLKVSSVGSGYCYVGNNKITVAGVRQGDRLRYGAAANRVRPEFNCRASERNGRGYAVSGERNSVGAVLGVVREFKAGRSGATGRGRERNRLCNAEVRGQV